MGLIIISPPFDFLTSLDSFWCELNDRLEVQDIRPYAQNKDRILFLALDNLLPPYYLVHVFNYFTHDQELVFLIFLNFLTFLLYFLLSIFILTHLLLQESFLNLPLE